MGKSYANDMQVLMALEAARRAQALLWDRQAALARAMGQRLGQPLTDGQDAAMCVFVQGLAVSDGALADGFGEVKRLVQRVRAA